MIKIEEFEEGKREGVITTGCKFDERQPGTKYIEITRKNEHVLSPSWKLINWYKNSEKRKVEQTAYVRQFIKEIRGDLDSKSELIDLSISSEDICLLCYEGDGQFCHRHIIHRIIRYLRLGLDWNTIFNAIEDLGWKAGYEV